MVNLPDNWLNIMQANRVACASPGFPETSEPGLILQAVKGSHCGNAQVPTGAA